MFNNAYSIKQFHPGGSIYQALRKSSKIVIVLFEKQRFSNPFYSQQILANSNSIISLNLLILFER